MSSVFFLQFLVSVRSQSWAWNIIIQMGDKITTKMKNLRGEKFHFSFLGIIVDKTLLKFEWDPFTIHIVMITEIFSIFSSVREIVQFHCHFIKITVVVYCAHLIGICHEKKRRILIDKHSTLMLLHR